VTINVPQYLRNPVEFRGRVIIDTDHGPRRLADVVEPWQSSDFTLIDPGLRRAAGIPCEGGTSRIWLERPRGHSKTSDIALCATWWLFAAPRRVSGIVAAADEDQAGLLRDAIAKLVQLNRWLSVLDVQRQRVVNKSTGAELTIISSDVASSWGHTVSLVIADEVSHWVKRDLFDSLLSSAAKRADCLMLCILNAGFQQDWCFGVRAIIRDDPAWAFSRLEGPQASWITAARLAEQQRLLPAAAFARLWLNQWSSGAGDALPQDAIQRALTLAGPVHDLSELPPGHVCIGGLDLGLRRDASSLVILSKSLSHSVEVERDPVETTPLQQVLADLYPAEHGAEVQTEYIHHEGTGRLRLVSVQSWSGTSNAPVSINQIEAAILDAHRRYGLALLHADVWQAAQLIERLRGAGVPVVGIDPTGGNIKEQASALLRCFNDGAIDLYPDEGLLKDLSAARIAEKQYGFRVESPRDASGHADRLSALLLALHAARRLDFVPALQPDDQLVCWP
jgi:phage terminase large subunit-like protein